MKKSSRILAFVLTLLMVVSLMPVSALADELAPASAAESLLLPGMVDIPAIEETEEPVATETPAPTEAPAETEQPEATEAPVLPELDVVLPEVGSAADAVIGEAAETEEEAPVEDVEEEVAEDGANEVTTADYLFIATDRHANTSIIGSIINNMESAIGENELDYLGLGGDMVGSGNSHPSYNSSTVLGEVTGATSSLSATNVDIVAGIHDVNVTDDAGIVLPYKGGGAEIYEGDRYYVYGVEEYCISEDSEEEDFWSGQAEAFVKWATNTDGDDVDIDTSKVIIVVSHYPLHAKRGDNLGAGYWHNALNEVATGSATGEVVIRNVVFFHGHNHTVDSNEYYYAPGSTMAIQSYIDPSGVATAAAKAAADYDYYEELYDPEKDPNAGIATAAAGGSSTNATASGTNATIYYAYATAGYLNQNSKATLVTITDDAITLTKYTASGSGTSMGAVERVDETVTLSSVAVTNLPAKTEYTIGEELDATGIVVTATYSDGSTAPVDGWSLSEVDMSTAGTKTVTVTYEGKTTTFDITVKDPASSVNTVTGFIYGVEVDGVQNSLGSIQATAMGLTDITANVNTEEAVDTALCEVFYENDYVSFDVTLEGHTEGNEVFYSVAVLEDTDTTNLAVYHVAENGTLTQIDCTLDTDVQGNKYVEFTTDLTGTFAYGALLAPDGYTLSSLEVTNVVTTDYFLGDSLDMVNPVVTVTYTNADSEEFKRVLYYDYDLDYDMTVAGPTTVTVSYTEGEITRSDTFDITVWQKTFPDETTGVSVEVNVPGATELTVAPSENANVAEAIRYVIEDGTYVAYDIELAGYNDDESVTVTLPIPEGVTNPVVYYVSDDGKTVTNMNATVNEDGTTVSFTTDHFSTYVIGENTEITVPENVTATGSGTTTTTEKKTVYVLTSSISSGNEYLIVNSNSAGSYYALANNSGSVAATGVTVVEDDTIGTYIELDDATDELWTVSNSYRFQNGGYYLRYNNGLGLSTNNYTTWSYSNNRLSYTSSGGGGGGGGFPGSSSSSTYYLRYNSGWTVTSNSSSASSIYFYVPTEIEVETTTTVSGTYSIEGENISVVVSAPVTNEDDTITYTTANLTSTLTFTPESGTATTTDTSTTATYEIVTVDKDGNTVNGDPNGIISDISGNAVTFTGEYGTALVKVSYTTDFGEVTDYITIEATAPYYTIDLCKPVVTYTRATAYTEGETYYTETDGVYTEDTGVTADNFAEGTYYTATTTYESITAPVALKGVAAGDTYSVWAVVKEHNAEHPDGEDLDELGDDLTWSISNSSIASIDEKTGVITFTGDNYGTIQVTVAYEGADGKVITDTITISVTESPYIVPGDGTNDFPEYPNEGAVRFDKTATAVGNYSETGIAMVELSMTGVPYGTTTKTDVVVMVDMTASMSDDDVTAAELAVQELIKTLIYNEENEEYDENMQIFVSTFSSGSQDSSVTITDVLTGTAITNETELNAAVAKIDFTQSSNGGGTRYNVALADVYETLNRDGHADKQYVVFVSDGVCTAYSPLTDGEQGTTITGSNSETASLAAGWFDDTGAVTEDFETEYYTYLFKTAGIPVYTIGANLTALSDAADVLNHMSSNYSPDGKTSTKETKYSFFTTTSGGITDETLTIFKGIGTDIREAATNVVVEDKIGSNYTMNFSIPGYGTDNAVSSDALEGTTEFYIQVVEYTLNADKERDGDPSVLENFTFNADGSLKSHTINSVACSDCTHVTVTDGVITKIEGTYFTYENITDEKDEDYGEYLTWKADKISSTELALQYFAYLDNSTGVSAEDQIAAGTYYTNEYATLTYTNYLENEVQQKFPVPQMTWNGAQVSYTFYLVNDAGQPVNRAGRVIPFAEAVYVTEVFTYSIVWNDLEQSAGLEAERLAVDLVPDVYELYDDDATYNIHVYEDEKESNLNNHFVIGGDVTDDYNTENSWTNASTTYVFNNKSDAEKYNTVGAYIANDGNDTTTATTYLCKSYAVTDEEYTTSVDEAGLTVYTVTAATYTGTESQVAWANLPSTTGASQVGGYAYYVDENGEVYTIVQKTDGTEVREGFDFSNTTVAFAVVWKPELKEDVVVIDYGLDVEVDVIATDSMAAGVVGVREDAVDDVAINNGFYERKEAETKTEVDVYLDDLKIGNAAVESLKTVRFSLDKENGMQMSEPVKFYYEADVNYYKGSELQTTSMYSSVTVIPATSIYYEDSFVTFKDGSTSEGATTWATEGSEGSEGSALQGMDRPGPDKIGEIEGQLKDADNVYGYDSAYDNMATYSMGSARYVTVSAANNPSKGGAWPTAEFTFTGIGFDIISMTDNTTGTIFVDVYAGTDTTGDAAYNWVVDTYYGYTREEDGWLKHTWTYYADGWHVSTEEVEAEGEDGVETLPESPEVGQSYVIYEKNYIWTVTKGDNALYQIPVIKSPEMTYGTYTVVITPKFASFFDHTAKAQYDFYLDAIRIYNPTGDLDDDTLDVYTQDEEAYPTFVELRNNLLTAGTFDAIKDEDDEVTGVVFIDGVGNTAEVADYAAYGPNNEVYLESSQAIAFNVSAAGSPEKVMLGVKSLNTAPATITISRVTEDGKTAATKNITVNTATDMYYDISDIVLEEVTENGESYNIVGDGVIVIQNSGANLVSLTNIKTTFSEPPVETTGFNLLMSRSYADVATAYIAETTTDAVVDENTSTGDDVTDDTTGTEGAPGDEETGGDAGDDTTGDDTTGDDTTGDDTTEEDDDTTSAAVSLINTVNKILQSIRNVLSSILGWLGR